MKSIRGVSVALSCLLAFPIFAQEPEVPAAAWAPGGPSRAEDVHVYLYTFGPGDEVPSWWGHIALVVEDRRLHEGRLYNYGMFSFDNAMLLKFARGRLEFWVGEAGIAGTVRAYAWANRSVHVQELNLMPEARLKAAQSLAVAVRPENRTYLYEHYHDNCSTRPRDVIDAAVDGQLKAQTSKPGRMTLRLHTQRYTSVNPPMSVFLDFMMNDSIDQPIAQSDEAFLPDELERQLDLGSYRNAAGETVPLVLSKHELSHPRRAPTPGEPPRYEPYLLALGLLLGLWTFGTWWLAQGAPGAPPRPIVRSVAGVWQALLGLVLGVPGSLLVIMWIATNHVVTYHNENLFLASPITLWLIPRGLALARGKVAAARRLAQIWYVLCGLGLLGLLLKALPGFDQNNHRIQVLLLPIGVGGAAAGWLATRRREIERERSDGGGREGTGDGTAGAA